MKTLKGVKLDDINNFSTIADAVYNYIMKYWTGTIKPKGYKKFLENYEDYAGMEDIDHAKLEDEFKGFKDGGACSFPFPIKVSLPHVAYDDTNQGRNPLRTLISACLGQGLVIGQKRGELNSLKALEILERSIKFEIAIAKETNKKVNIERIDNAFNFFKEYSQI